MQVDHTLTGSHAPTRPSGWSRALTALGPALTADPLRTLVGAVVLVGGGFYAYAAAHVPTAAIVPWRLPLAFLIGVSADLSLLHIRFGHNRYSFTWAEAMVTLGLVVIPFPWMVLVMPLGVAAVHLSVRRPPSKILFNTFGMAAGVSLARLTFVAAGGGYNRLEGWRAFVGLAAASLVLFLWNMTTVIGAVALSQGVTIRSVFVRTAPGGALVWVGNTAAGLGLATIAVYDERILMILPVVLAATYLIYRSYLGMARESESWRLIQEATRHSVQLDPTELARAVTAGLRDLLRAEYVELTMVDHGSASVYQLAGETDLSETPMPTLDVAPAFWPRASSEHQLFCVQRSEASGPQAEELDALGLASLAVAPLLMSNSCVGMLRVGFRGRVKMTARELQVLATFANHASASVMNALLFRRTNELFEQTSDLFERHRRMTDALGEAVLAADETGLITFANPATSVMLATPVQDLLGLSIHDAFHRASSDHGPSDCLLHRVLKAGGTVRADDHSVTRADGRSVDVAFTASPLMRADSIVGAVLTVRDVSERRRLERELSYQAYHDSMTGTANRTMFLDRLALALGRRTGTSLAVLFIDLDRFKVINDSLGHRRGDGLLRQLARRMGACLRPTDLLARFGGDEFTVLIPDLIDDEDAELVAGRICQAVSTPIMIDGRDIHLSASVGVHIVRPGEHDLQSVIHCADLAMYRAKARGGGCHMLFGPDMADAPLEKLECLTGLRHAIENKELLVYYQPMVDVNNGRMRGVEALVRWCIANEVRGPAEFIGLAEDSGLILGLGREVLEQSCRQVRRWQREIPGAEGLMLSVNLSARQFLDDRLVADIATVLTETGFDPGCLSLEITETVMMRDVESTMSILAALRDLGVRLAIDDFGTGYSSLSYLKTFPIDAVKIDRSFVGGLCHEQVDTEIVLAVIRLANSLRITPVAEGVETEEQLTALRRLGCPMAQGYLFSSPQPAERVEAMLAMSGSGHPHPALMLCPDEPAAPPAHLAQ